MMIEKPLPEAILDKEIFERLKNLGGPPLIIRLIEIYFKTVPGYLDGINQSYADADCKALKRAAHALKSAAGNLGLKQLQALCQALENAAGEQNLEEAHLCIGKMTSIQEKSWNALQQRYGQLKKDA